MYGVQFHATSASCRSLKEGDIVACMIAQLVSTRGRPRVPTAKAGRSTYTILSDQWREMGRKETECAYAFCGPSFSVQTIRVTLSICASPSAQHGVNSRPCTQGPSTAFELSRDGRVVLVTDKSIAVNRSARKTSIMWRGTPVDQRMFSSSFLLTKEVVGS